MNEKGLFAIVPLSGRSIYMLPIQAGADQCLVYPSRFQVQYSKCIMKKK